MTVTQGGGGCPDEANSPPGAPGPVDDAEWVVRCVRLSTELVWNQGIAGLDITAVRQEDLEGKRGKSVSVLRDPLTPAPEIARRAGAQNKQHPEWDTDPVLAKAEVISLRTLSDSYKAAPNWRLVCVNADPTTAADDPLGACPTHASIVRSQPLPPPGKLQRLDYHSARLKVAAAFTIITHASGAAVAQI